MPSTDHETDAIPPSPPHAAEAGSEAIRPIRLWVFVVAAGFIAGLVSWLAGEASLDVVEPRRRTIIDRGITLHVSDRRAEATAISANAGLAFFLLGASLGGALGAAGRLARGSNRSVGSAASFGMGAGALAAGLASLAILPLYDAYRLGHPDEASRDLILPLLVHIGVWSAAGVAGGPALARGLGRTDRRTILKIALGGLVGAAVGATVFELIGAFAMPDAETARYVSRTAASRLLARLLVCVFAASGAVLAVFDAAPGGGGEGGLAA